MEWKDFDITEKSTWPTECGHYRVLIRGDSEAIDGHVIYAFDDYETWATVDYISLEEEIIRFNGEHDEDEHLVISYCGPYIIPERK